LKNNEPTKVKTSLNAVKNKKRGASPPENPAKLTPFSINHGKLSGLRP
jgi:hypothetical protein